MRAQAINSNRVKSPLPMWPLQLGFKNHYKLVFTLFIIRFLILWLRSLVKGSL